MKEDLDNFYLAINEPLKSTMLVLRDIILEYIKCISATLKYGMPCFLYKNNIFCYLWFDKKTAEPYILMAEGNYLTNPHLEKGNRSRMKILRVNPEADIPIEIVQMVLQEAIDLYINGIVKLK